MSYRRMCMIIHRVNICHVDGLTINDCNTVNKNLCIIQKYIYIYIFSSTDSSCETVVIIFHKTKITKDNCAVADTTIISDDHIL